MEITKLGRHIAMNSPIVSDWNHKRYLEDGETIEFTSYVGSITNPDFRINNDNSRSIWYSQLQQIGFSEDLKIIAHAGIKFKNEEPLQIRQIRASEFVEKVKHRKFMVQIFDNICYTINRQSNTLKTLYDQTEPGVVKYIINCITNDKIEDLGDMIKPGSLYNLIEL